MNFIPDNLSNPQDVKETLENIQNSEYLKYCLKNIDFNDS